MNTRIVLLIDNVHMGLGHDGLALVAKKFRRDPKLLQEHELLMFLNRKRDKLKIMGAGGKVLGYLRMPSGQRIMLDAIQFIPRTFGATGFNYDEALQQALGARLSAASRARSPLQAYRAMANAGLVDNRANV